MAVLGDTKAVSLTLLDGVIGHLNPKTTALYDLGTSSLSWRNIYGTLKGNADTATKWTSAQKVYVALGTASTTSTIQGGSTSASAIGIDGTLAIGHGGTGATTAAAARTNLGLGTMATETATNYILKSALSNVTNHQQVHEVAWDSTNKKITRSKNGSAGDVVSFVAGTGISLTAAAGSLTIINNYSLPTAGDNTLGGIKTGYIASGKTYAIKVDSNGNAYVNVPWTDTKSFTITANATDGLWDLTGTSDTNKVTYALAPYSTKQSSASFYTGDTAPSLTTRLNYDGYFYATKLYSGGVEVLTSHQSLANYKTKQTAVSDPTANDTAIAFIASISQDANGVITPTKKTVRTGTTSQTGIVQLNSATDSNSTTEAATPSAVKSAYDLANDHKYWANLVATSTAAYNKTPELATIKLNGNTSATGESTKNVSLIYNSSTETLNFVFV